MARIDCGKIPEQSIANGIDLGLHYRVHLEELSLQELQIIAKVRHYYNIVKLESKSRFLQQHYQSAIKGSSIVFEHDAPDVDAHFLSPEDMN